LNLYTYAVQALQPAALSIFIRPDAVTGQILSADASSLAGRAFARFDTLPIPAAHKQDAAFAIRRVAGVIDVASATCRTGFAVRHIIRIGAGNLR